MSPGNNCIRKISDGIVAVISGSGIAGSRDGSGWEASFNQPKGLAVNDLNNIFVADKGNHKIRVVFGTDWSVSTVAGAGTRGFRDGNPDQALFNEPEAVAIDWEGNLYVADTMNHVIRR
jgi:DNA-binding beta-propeller fold protein YncE